MTSSSCRVGRWQSLQVDGSCPSARAGHCCVTTRNTLCFFGGSTRAPAVSNELWTLDVTAWRPGSAKVQWQKLQTSCRPPLAPRAGSTITELGTTLFIFGGQDSLSGRNSAETIAIDTITWDWQILQIQGLRPPARHSHSAGCIHGHLLLVFGGAGDTSLLNDIWSLDTRTLEWHSHAAAGLTPLPREMHTGVFIGPSSYLVFGGRTLAEQTGPDGTGMAVPVVLGDIALLNVRDMTWTVSTGCPFKRCSHSAVAIPPAGHDAGELQQVLAYGGFDGEAVTGDLILINPRSMTAEIIDLGSAALTPSNRFAHSAAMLPYRADGGQAMAIFGGMTPQKDLSDLAVWHWGGAS